MWNAIGTNENANDLLEYDTGEHQENVVDQNTNVLIKL